MSDVIQLFPTASAPRALTGLYLDQQIRQSIEDKRPFVYANFVTSLDGRIAVPKQNGDGLTVPKNVANDRDWRLFQELATQADLIISSGRYLRDWAKGNAQEILQVDDPKFADLRDWRQQNGLKPTPDIAIISRSLDFPIPDVLTADGRRAVIFTTANPDPDRVAEIEEKAGELFVVGEDSVDGEQLVQKMGELGYQAVYSAAGPKILHLLLAGGVLDRLYLTFANRIVGGDPFSTIVEGPLLETAVDFTLNTLYFDPEAPDNLGQLFASYNVVRHGS